MNKIAGALLVFRRPDYTEQVVRSLEKCKEVNDIDWYVFQDGLKNRHTNRIYAEEDKWNEVANVINTSSLNIINFDRGVENLSIPGQKQKAHQLFNDYKLVYFFEDDLVVGKYYLRLLRVASEQLPDNIAMFFSVKKGSPKTLIRTNVARVWGYYMTRQVYNKIKSKYNYFAESWDNADYNYRPKQKNLGKLINHVRPHLHDMAITSYCRSVGAYKLESMASRAIYIGRKGDLAYKTDRLWTRNKMNRQSTRIEYPIDRKIKRFNIR